jgi:hypothetical protein
VGLTAVVLGTQHMSMSEKMVPAKRSASHFCQNNTVFCIFTFLQLNL